MLLWGFQVFLFKIFKVNLAWRFRNEIGAQASGNARALRWPGGLSRSPQHATVSGWTAPRRSAAGLAIMGWGGPNGPSSLPRPSGVGPRTQIAPADSSTASRVCQERFTKIDRGVFASNGLLAGGVTPRKGGQAAQRGAGAVFAVGMTLAPPFCKKTALRADFYAWDFRYSGGEEGKRKN